MAIDDGAPPAPLETRARAALQDLEAIDGDMLDGQTLASIVRLVRQYSPDASERDLERLNAKLEECRARRRREEVLFKAMERRPIREKLRELLGWAN